VFVVMHLSKNKKLYNCTQPYCEVHMWQHPQNMYKHLYVVHQVQHDTKKGIAIMSLQLAPRRPPKNHCKSTNFSVRPIALCTTAQGGHHSIFAATALTSWRRFLPSWIPFPPNHTAQSVVCCFWRQFPCTGAKFQKFFVLQLFG
jgi:hypothetical protein